MNKNNNQNNIKGYNINNIPLKKKRSKLIPIIASILGIVLLGGGFYFYNSYSKISKDDELYSPIIKKYKEAMDTGETKFDYELNNYAIERYNSSGKNKDYLKFTYFDMDKDGQDEMLIYENSNLASPIAIYNIDKQNKLNVLYKTNSRSSQPVATFYKDKTMVVNENENFTDRITTYKIKDNGIRYEITHDIDFGKYHDLKGKYKDIVTKEDFTSKEEFFNKYPLSNDKIDLSKIELKSLYNYKSKKNNQGEEKKDSEQFTKTPEYNNLQLALIGRAVIAGGTDPQVGTLKYDTTFSIRGNDATITSDFGSKATVVIVDKKSDGIEIKIPDYSSTNHKLKVIKTLTYKEIQETFKKEDMDKINRIIEEYKNTNKYKNGT
ncbi:hypothetical protein [uncultured Gemella sp.]|uniref:hypothetical protein n=1 Tax=uncultured Gemella sp. TaxID=254352 RepID=UPI0025F0BB09|nr:hypothetical protein [uncultured Gemella sp.]